MTCHTLEEFYHIDGHTFEKQYKEVLSGFRQWEQLEHADKWLLFPENIGPCLAIDESSLSNGELYTFVTNREVRTREQSLVAVVAGTKAEDGVYFVEADWLLDILRTANMDDYSSLQYFQNVLRTSGIIDKLEEMGIEEGDTVSIFDFEFEYLR